MTDTINNFPITTRSWPDFTTHNDIQDSDLFLSRRGSTTEPLTGSGLLNTVGGLIDDRVADYVTPEMFGNLGINDNQLFLDAIATGKPILALAPTYNVAGLVSTNPADITFGRNTQIINTQTSGTKVPSFTFQGNLVGSPVTVTALSGADIPDSVVVSDSSFFNIGDTVLLQENNGLTLEDDYSQGASLQDANYREFCTILNIVGNEIFFEEYLRFHQYDIAKSITLQKASFLENVHIRGGIFKGGGTSGGGIALEYCRYSSAIHMKGRGLSKDNPSGGVLCEFRDCWESHRDDHDSKWTLFGALSFRNQSCTFGTMKSKRTLNGGFIIGGDRFCDFDNIVQDSTGDDNGDGVGLHDGARGNTFGTITMSGSRCYGMWVKQFCDDNSFNCFSSNQGITFLLYLFGDRNKFGIVKASRHPAGVAIYGSDNTILEGDVETEGSSLLLLGTGSSGNKIAGRFKTKDVFVDSFDLILGDVSDTTVDIYGSLKGMTYALGVLPNHTNNIVVKGDNPYILKLDTHSKGYTWSNRETGVSSIPRNLLVPVRGALNGLGNLTSTVTGDVAKVYKISIKSEVFLPSTYSEYLLLDVQGTLELTVILEGSSTFAPRLSLVSGEVMISNNGSTDLAMSVNVDQF